MFVPTSTMLVLGGSALAVVIVFQMLLGYRRIKLKGRLHLKAHRAVAWTICAFALVHATVALLYLGVTG